MLRNLPFRGDFPIIQQFGDSPRTFRNVRCHGVAMRGHHGVDFGLPVGEPVLAVAGGEVAAAGNDAAGTADGGGFGRFVLLDHRWGQTLYAHLSRLDVRAGDKIAAGHRLGRSGDSGLSLGPHLHFGLRINPYAVDDRWCGYTDPMPYLHRIAFGRGPAVGPHILGSVADHLHLLLRWQPRLISVFEPDPDEMRRLRRTCPNSLIVGRISMQDAGLVGRIRRGPRAAAHWAHAQTLPHLSADVDYYQVANEMLQDEASLSLLSEFELARMRLAEDAGYACALFGLGAGSPDLPGHDCMARWRQLYPALARAETHGHIVALHQYGMPDLWGPHGRYDWYICRLEHQVLRRLPFKHVRFAVTEMGIDGLIAGGEPSGWRNFTDGAAYTQQLHKHARYVERFSGRILGAGVFTLGHFPPWDSYDIHGEVAHALAATSERGVWADVKTRVTGIEPGGFDPVAYSGVEALPDRALDRPAPASPGGESPLPGRRLDARFDAYHMQIKSICERPDQPCSDPDVPPHGPGRGPTRNAAARNGSPVDTAQEDVVYLIKDVFMTANGSWEIDGGPHDVPDWARNDYLVPEFLEAGADRHLFAAVIGLDGKLTRSFRVTYWPDGFHRLGDPNYDGYVTVQARPQSGWANLFMAGSSYFDPDRGESGPWCWMPNGAAEVMCGGGLPLNHHVSTFVVWQAVPRAAWEKVAHAEGVNPFPYPGLAHPVPRRLNFCATYFGLSIQPMTKDPAQPHDGPAYVVRDLFTVYSDTQHDNPELGARPPWASDDYALPPVPEAVGAYGGDDETAPPRIYAAVLDADGALIPAREIAFVRGDFDALRTGDSSECTVRYTDADSCWAHLDMCADDAYSPARGQAGPWCCAPAGAAEAVCGAGLPFGKKISVFAVWEAAPGPR